MKVTQFTGTRVLFFDLLRVIAISMILLSHMLITIGPPVSQWGQFYIGIKNFYWTTWGEIGVTIFLIISGLSLEYIYGNKKINFGSYYLKRIIRIYPTYYMSLFIALGIHILVASWAYIKHTKQFILLPGFDYFDFFLTLSGFNAFAGKWGGSLVWTSWFIGLIMTLYLFYPAISYGIRKYPWGVITVLLIVSVVSMHIIGQSSILSGNPMQWFPLNRIFEFGFGVFLVRTLKQDFLLSFNKLLKHLPFLPFLSTISFPLFLIHDPLRRFIYFGPKNLTSLIIGIPVFIILSIILSKCALMIDEKVQTRLKSKLNLRKVTVAGN